MIDDEGAIRRLTHLAAWYGDTGEHELLTALFTHDAVHDMTAVTMGGKPGPRIENRGRMPAPSSEAVQQAPPHVLHLVSNNIVEVNGDTATGSCAALGFAQREDGTTHLAGVRYDDEYVRTPDGWRFTSRKLSWFVPVTVV